MIMLKEDFDLKRQVITEKLLEANGECSHLREEMHKLNLSQAFFENDISKIEGIFCKFVIFLKEKIIYQELN